jgi:hypothetical protein
LFKINAVEDDDEDEDEDENKDEEELVWLSFFISKSGHTQLCAPAYRQAGLRP